jgi:hypothetical protein
VNNASGSAHCKQACNEERKGLSKQRNAFPVSFHPIRYCHNATRGRFCPE